jgi:hypothetical protein
MGERGAEVPVKGQAHLLTQSQFEISSQLSSCFGQPVHCRIDMLNARLRMDAGRQRERSGCWCDQLDQVLPAGGKVGPSILWLQSSVDPRRLVWRRGVSTGFCGIMNCEETVRRVMQ